MYALTYLPCIYVVNSDHGVLCNLKAFAIFLSVRYDKINVLSFSGIRNVVLAQA